MRPDPTVSVIVPLYNGARYIEETLNSVAAQSMSHFEVLVVDDGSSDDGRQKVLGHPVGARLIQQEHLGVAIARNRGLAEARGRWVTFLDQDDLWHPSRLDRLVHWFAKHENEPVVATTEVTFDTTDERAELVAKHPQIADWPAHHVRREAALTELVDKADTKGSDEVETADLTRMLCGPVTASTSFMAEPRTLQLAGGCAPHAPALDDYWMLVNVARMRPFPKIDQPTVFYRVHLGATSRTTRLALPFLASSVALRLGGGLIPMDDGLKSDLTGELHAHLLDEMLRSTDFDDPYFRHAVKHLAAVLWPEGRKAQIARAEVRRRTPSGVLGLLRDLRRR